MKSQEVVLVAETEHMDSIFKEALIEQEPTHISYGMSLNKIWTQTEPVKPVSNISWCD